MARPDVRPTLLPSLLDRLIDLDPDTSVEANWSRSQGLRELKLSVQRDLEALLNTRKVLIDDDRADTEEELGELVQSVLNYGLPDLTAIGRTDSNACEALRVSVEEAIRRFEPRLTEIYVSLGDAEDNADRRVRFIIDAQLKMEPNPEPVRFDTIVRTMTGEYQVKAEA